jgi:hypothetical protein
MSLRVPWKNRKLRKSRPALEKQYNSVARESKGKKDRAILSQWYSINGLEFDFIDAEIKHNDTRDLLESERAVSFFRIREHRKPTEFPKQ